MRELPGGAMVHESSYVDEGARIGAGTRIWHFCHVASDAEIGERCNLGQNVVVMSGTRLGRNVKVQNNVSIYEGVVCEDDVFLGPSMVFTNVMNPRSHVSRKREYQTTLVRRGATIGANATVVCGISLGEYSFIGAGAVVTRDVRSHALMAGVPARQIGWMCQCGERLPAGLHVADGAELECARCGSVYAGDRGAIALVRGGAGLASGTAGVAHESRDAPAGGAGSS